MNDDCPLCGPLPGEFAENEVATVRLSEEVACEGHAVLTARNHVENVSELSAEEARHFFELYRLSEHALIEVFGADRVLAVKLGLAVPHLHIHLYPVTSQLSRAQVDAMLSRETRVEISDAELQRRVEQLRRFVSRDTS